MIKITPEEIRLLSQYIYKISGIVLDDKKAYLFKSRLARLLKEQTCASYKELYLKAASDGTRKLERKVIDAITTGETLFFRDHSPFEMLKHKILPDLIDRRASTVAGNAGIPIRIWSAGCSTGQEVYSIAMVLKETLIDLNRYLIVGSSESLLGICPKLQPKRHVRSVFYQMAA